MVTVILSILSIMVVVAVGIFFIRKILSDKKDGNFSPTPPPSEKTCSTDCFDQEKIQEIRNNVQGKKNQEQPPKETVDPVFQAQAERLAAEQRMSTARKLKEVAEEIEKVATKMHTAEGQFLTALGRKKTRLEKEKELFGEELKHLLFQENLLADKKKLLDEKYKLAEQKIADELKIETAKMAAETKSFEFDLELKRKKETAEISSKVKKQIESLEETITEIKKFKGKKREANNPLGFLTPAMIILTIGFVLIILEKINLI